MNSIINKSVGEMVRENYRTAAVFKKYGIDFCCNGKRTIKEACELKKIKQEEITNELNNLNRNQADNPFDFSSWDPDLLIDYIEKKHHRYINNTVPILQNYLKKLCSVHGIQHPELFEITDHFNKSVEVLADHMSKEENILFPLIRNLISDKNNMVKNLSVNGVSVQNPINVMMYEHETEGERFSKIAKLSSYYNPPEDACNTYKVAFSMLQEFESDLHLHIHLENNILFPKALELEKSISI